MSFRILLEYGRVEQRKAVQEKIKQLPDVNQVWEAESFQVAIEYLQREQIDLLITGLDGWPLSVEDGIAAIKKRAPHVVILAFSALLAVEVVTTALNAGLHEFIPWNDNTVKQLPEILERRLQNQEENPDGALISPEKIFRLLAETTTDMISLHALDMRILYISPACERLLGYLQEELEGRIPLQWLHIEDARRVMRECRPILIQGTPVQSFDVRFRHRDGHDVWLEASIQPIMEEKRATQYVVIARNITERKSADEALRAAIAYNQGLIQAIPDMLFVLDAEGKFLDYRADASQRLYALPEYFIGKSVDEVMPRHVAEKIIDAIEMAFVTGKLQAFEYDLSFQGEDEVFYYEVRLMCVGKDRVLALVREITGRRLSERALSDAQAQLAQRVQEMELRTRQISLLTEISNMLQTSISLEEAYEVISQYGRRLFPGSSGVMMISQSPHNILTVTSAWGDLEKTDQKYDRNDCWGIRRGRSFINQTMTNGLQCEHILPERLAEIGSYLCVPIMAQGEAIGLLHVQSPRAGEILTAEQQQFAEAFTEQLGLALSNLQLREKLHEQAIHEPLTGLYNRYYMEESLERELFRAMRTNRPVAIIIMDLDHFKQLNTEFGHPNVDQMLRDFGALLKNSVRGGDIACRYGGDEFLVIMPEISQEIAMRRGEQLRHQMSSIAVRGEGKDPRVVTISVGVALWPYHGNNAAEVLQAADQALFLAKGRGGNCVVIALNDAYVEPLPSGDNPI